MPKDLKYWFWLSKKSGISPKEQSFFSLCYHSTLNSVQLCHGFTCGLKETVHYLYPCAFYTPFLSPNQKKSHPGGWWRGGGITSFKYLGFWLNVAKRFKIILLTKDSLIQNSLSLLLITCIFFKRNTKILTLHHHPFQVTLPGSSIVFTAEIPLCDKDLVEKCFALP